MNPPILNISSHPELIPDAPKATSSLSVCVLSCLQGVYPPEIPGSEGLPAYPHGTLPFGAPAPNREFTANLAVRISVARPSRGQPFKSANCLPTN